MTIETLGAQFTEQFLEHYGVKGMRWGIRKRDTSPQSVTLRQKPGKRVKAKGGKFQPAHEDAVRVAALKQRSRKSTSDSLSTKELQDLVQRMNLEQQLERLDPNQGNIGKALAKTLVNGQTGKLAVSGLSAAAEATGKIANPHVSLAVTIGKAMTGGGSKKKK